MKKDHEDIEQSNKEPKTQWLWLIGLCVGGGLSMYLLAKVTRMIGLWAGLGS